jgi:flagellar basal-body rod modification protein FlgD
MAISAIQPNDKNLAGDPGIGKNGNTAAELKNEFLTLMVAQIRNQDPLNPLDGAQYVSQLAQFSTVEGIQNMSQLQTQNNILMDTMQVLQSTSLLGKQVNVPVDRIQLENSEQLKGKIMLPQNGENVVVRAIGADGQVVKETRLGARNAGETTFELPELKAGNYRLEVIAQHGDKKATYAPTLTRTIEKVSIPGNGGDVLLQISGVGNLSLFSINEFLGARS